MSTNLNKIQNRKAETAMRKLLFAAILLGPLVMPTAAQDQGSNYGKTPEKLVPYGRYQDAYVKHFQEPQPFTGAGREKLPPTDLTEVRIGLLAPLEGNVMAPHGIQMFQGATLAVEEANTTGCRCIADQAQLLGEHCAFAKLAGLLIVFPTLRV